MRLLKRQGPAPVAPSALGGAPVIVVDDNAYLHMAIGRALPTAQLREAYRLHELRAAVREDAPRAVVMSSRLPDGSGLDAIGELRADPAMADAVLVALTSAGIEWETVEAVAAGADAYLAKDGDLGLLGPVLEQLLELTPEERARRRAAIGGAPVALTRSAAV